MRINRFPKSDPADSPAVRRTALVQLSRIVDFLNQQEGLEAWLEEDPLVVRGHVGTKQLTWMLSCICVPGHYAILVSHFPVRIPPRRRKACMEAVTRANSGLGVGGFDLDLDSGLLVFRTAIPSTEPELNILHMGWMLAVHQHCFETYYPAFMAMVYGRISARKIIAKVEEQDDQPLELPSNGQEALPPDNSSRWN